MDQGEPHGTARVEVGDTSKAEPVVAEIEDGETDTTARGQNEQRLTYPPETPDSFRQTLAEHTTEVVRQTQAQQAQMFAAMMENAQTAIGRAIGALYHPGERAALLPPDRPRNDSKTDEADEARGGEEKEPLVLHQGERLHQGEGLERREHGTNEPPLERIVSPAPSSPRALMGTNQGAHHSNRSRSVCSCSCPDTGSSDSPRLNQVLSTMQLTQIPAPTFKGGSCGDYWEFRQAFRDHVEETTISDKMKLKLLLTAYTGPIKPILQGCLRAPNPTTGYE